MRNTTLHYMQWRRRRRGASRSRRPWAPFAVLLLAILAAFAGSGVFAACAYYWNVTAQAPDAQAAIEARGGGARIYDRNGVLLYEFLNDEYGFQDRVTLDRVSPLIQDATIAAEDASFYSNPGISISGISRAALENLRPGDEFLKGTGGSSITQQLVKQIYFTGEEREERSINRKLKEAALALELSQQYDKKQVLEWYLNEIPYGGTLRGIQAATRGYFNTDASSVTLAQAAFLAGLPQSPAEYDPFSNFPAAKARQEEVLDLMVRHGYISRDLANWAKLEQITLTPAARPFQAPHFVQYVADYIRKTLGEKALYEGGLEVTTSLDLGLQWQANASLEKYLSRYEASARGHNGSVVIINPPTGQILAMVGSRDYFREDIDGEVNNALALNSPGSTLKPFTYATTFKMGWGPDWPMVDTPITYREVDGKTFTPRNPDGRTRGVMPLKAALGNSFNIPAFKAILFAGVDNVVATAKAMGITSLDRDLGPALTLGGVDVSLLDVTYGYSTFANNGMMAGAPTVLSLPPGNRTLDPISVLKVTNRRGETLLDNTQPRFVSAIDPEYAYMITQILTDDANRQITYGRGSTLNIPGYKVAAKTGTSEPYEKSRAIGETWTYGYTPDIAVGVWVGNTDNSPMVNIVSTTIAGSTWHEVMVAALKDKPARDWVRPDGIVQARVCVPSGVEAPANASCRSATGMFARQAISNRGPNYWGGLTLSNPINLAALNTIPPEVTDWKRYIAEEYLRSFGGGRSQPSAEAQQPGGPAPAPNTAPPSGDAPAGGGGNGRGRRR